MMPLKYLKLIGGDEFIGSIHDEDVDYDLRVIHNPWRMLMTNQGYMPCPMPAKNITVNNVHILFEGDVDDELARVYNEKMGGIVVPPKGMVLPG